MVFASAHLAIGAPIAKVCPRLIVRSWSGSILRFCASLNRLISELNQHELRHTSMRNAASASVLAASRCRGYTQHTMLTVAEIETGAAAATFTLHMHELLITAAPLEEVLLSCAVAASCAALSAALLGCASDWQINNANNS